MIKKLQINKVVGKTFSRSAKRDTKQKIATQSEAFVIMRLDI